jgi:hypothetical protein
MHTRHPFADPSGQGRAAGSHLKAGDHVGFSRCQKMGRKKLHIVPTGGQNFNGQAERMIGLLKKQIWRSFEGKKSHP